MGEATETIVKEDTEGKFSNTPYVGTLANDGVQLAPFHDFDSQVPADLKSELEQIKKDIVDGKLKVESKASPKV
jgi:basic membrane protein A